MSIPNNRETIIRDYCKFPRSNRQLPKINEILNGDVENILIQAYNYIDFLVRRLGNRDTNFMNDSDILEVQIGNIPDRLCGIKNNSINVLTKCKPYRI